MNWVKFAIGEGLTKTTSSLIQKYVGQIMGTLEMGCMAGMIIGSIQMLTGWLGFVKETRNNKTTISQLVPDLRSVTWAILFGFFAALPGTIWAIYTFTLGADLGIRTMLIMGSIIPSAIIGRIFWKDNLGIFQILGILVFLLAIWSMLNFPNASVILSLPIWVPAVLVVTFTQSINEALSRAASVKLNIWVNGFWIGLSTIFFCLSTLITIAIFSNGLSLNIYPMFLLGSFSVGCIVVVMISFKLLSYAGGGTIALKKLIMNGVYLVSSAAVGIVIYGEACTSGKIVGVVLFFIAVFLTNKK